MLLIWHIIRMNKREFSKVSGCIGNTQKSIAFLPTSNKELEKVISKKDDQYYY